MSDKKSTFLERAAAIGANVSRILKDSTPVTVPNGTHKTMASSKDAAEKTAFKTLTRWVDVKESETPDLERFANFVDGFKNMKQELNHTQSLRQAMGMVNLVSTERFYPAMDGGLKEKLIAWLEHNVEDANGRTIARPETLGTDKKADLFQESASILLLLPFGRRDSWHHKAWVNIFTTHLERLDSKAQVALDSIPYWKFSKQVYNSTYGESWKMEIPKDSSVATITIYPVYCSDFDSKPVSRQIELWLKKAMRTNVPLYMVASNAPKITFSDFVDYYKKTVKDACEKLRFRAKITTVQLPLIWEMNCKKDKYGEVIETKVKDFNWELQEPYLTIQNSREVMLGAVKFDFKTHWYFQIHTKSGQKLLYRYDLVAKTWLSCKDTEASLGTIHIVPPELLKVSYYDKTEQKHKSFWSDKYLTDIVFKDCSFAALINANIFMDTFGEFENI